MTVNRRQMLKAAGGGVAGILLAQPAAGQTMDRVFVHPDDAAGSELISAITGIGGSVLLEFDNFDFVVASIPAAQRQLLEDDSRVAFIEDDGGIGIPSPPGGGDDSPFDGFPGGGDDEDLSCAEHPPQQSSWGYDRIGADEADEAGSGVDIAIFDTGIDTNHCDLDVRGGRNFTTEGTPSDYDDQHGHGTHCAGIACALDNDLGVVGVAPAANLYAVKILESDGSGRYSWMAAGVDWCMSEDIEIISMSLGGDSGSDTLDMVIEDAYEAGHLLVAAAGNQTNSGEDSCEEDNVSYPATHPGVLAISAMDQDDSIASYSSLGDEIELLAPGSHITSTDAGNRYRTMSGTSMAAPFVSGTACLVWAQRGASGPGPSEPVRSVLGDTAETVLSSCAEGHGLVDAAAASEAAEEGGDNGSAGPPNGGGDDDGDGNGDGPGIGSPLDYDTVSILGWIRNLPHLLLAAIASILAIPVLIKRLRDREE